MRTALAQALKVGRQIRGKTLDAFKRGLNLLQILERGLADGAERNLVRGCDCRAKFVHALGQLIDLLVDLGGI
ncbi:hypothetical protein ACH51_09605 [Ralstonia solanacearum]|nr:hypothetical protein ACH51_09605 [Ralstonia solanacearum]